MFDSNNNKLHYINPLKRLPDIPKDILRLLLFLGVFILMFAFGIVSISNIILWSLLTGIQIFLLVLHIKKKCKANKKEAEETLSEEDFLKQLNQPSEEKSSQIRENNSKLQDNFEENEYNDNKEFEEYDLSEELDKIPVYSSGEDGI